MTVGLFAGRSTVGHYAGHHPATAGWFARPGGRCRPDRHSTSIDLSPTDPAVVFGHEFPSNEHIIRYVFKGHVASNASPTIDPALDTSDLTH
ncbi:hypothetical protein O7632_12655 [Solwaraspora sp. WMMD406]|uniref:hypothetical protein n=1 Tax=Solwaraspora sp. WMMD406 TaxID=3016095 RepID=UPI002415F3C9|nr:hypothetical protein [Solwaraspora sp. WMMD406]MDG4764941.1 hypothetical protein [Solwaraspora sp. WMMD406]